MVCVAVFQRNLLFASSEGTVKMDVSSEQYPFEVILCLVTVLPQGNVKLHFDLVFAAYFNGGWREECGKVVEIYDSCFSRQKCNCGRLCTTLWVFIGVEQELGHLSCACH